MECKQFGCVCGALCPVRTPLYAFCVVTGILFPLFSITYIVAPHSKVGQTMRKPFIKFICHSASYFTFLCKYIVNPTTPTYLHSIHLLSLPPLFCPHPLSRLLPYLPAVARPFPPFPQCMKLLFLTFDSDRAQLKSENVKNRTRKHDKGGKKSTKTEIDNLYRITHFCHILLLAPPLISFHVNNFWCARAVCCGIYAVLDVITIFPCSFWCFSMPNTRSHTHTHRNNLCKCLKSCLSFKQFGKCSIILRARSKATWPPARERDGDRDRGCEWMCENNTDKVKLEWQRTIVMWRWTYLMSKIGLASPFNGSNEWISMSRT